ncbi:hypothetical protein Mpt1_c04590 [Candidatus Methanoplasma termitum]|uniref:Uncharacterized protein n=1 Tax=Candidatus Methanoplasma termitum TaxID=1577791 RepID=A0A0A7LFR7_9ARCH|nr:hypothetical protein [Candidatus Methanoplasma termitum]AIZ56351.1 hypothetical protein Mpt1_c04590 [Candidatus Methanoplasma termitum]MCL2333384.1 hypothetical protein [Candidatus Methanoplasma sp.]
MGYKVETIGLDRSYELRSKYKGLKSYSSKVNISGLCVEFLTEDREHLKMWEDNFYSMSEEIRSHAKIYSIRDPSHEMKVLFEPSTNVAFLYNFDYYGWIKSIALGISGNILEEAHDIYSVHGAVLDIDGKGVTLIAPSKTGKTTQSWGLLRMENAYLVSDDWYFVKLGGGRPIAYGSEKNCYIDADIGDVWEEYKPLVSQVVFDNKGRGIANVRWVTGESSVIPMTKIRCIFLLKRDKDDPVTIRRLSPKEGVDYLLKNDLCNPHQIIWNDHKKKVRTAFFADFLSKCEVYSVNTIKTPQETQELIRNTIIQDL